MSKNDDGEFELVLGNRQLLSGFFIIVILFGIFFTMGYFVGRSSSPSSVAPVPTGGTAAAASPAPPLAPGQAEVVTSEPKRGSAAPVSTRTALGSGAAAAEEPSVEPPAQKPPAKTKPVAETKAADPPPKAEKKKDPKEAAGAGTSGGGEVSLTRPKKGDMYLQVSAPLPAAAKGVVGALQRQGIDAIVAPGPVGKDTVRVLVGPLADSASAGKMRAKLAEVGFKDTFVQKY